MNRSTSRLRRNYLKTREVLGFKPLPEEQLGLMGVDPFSEKDHIKLPDDGEALPINLGELYLGPAYKTLIRDQGRTNRCTGFTGAMGLTLMHAKLDALTENTAPPVEYSANFAYWHARRNKHLDSGAYMRDLMDALHKQGGIEGSLWTDGESPLLFNPKLAEQNRFRIDGYERVITGHVDSVKMFNQVLSVEKIPIFIGMMLHQNATNQAARTGRFEMPASNDKLLGGHAMLIIGWTVIRGRTWYITVNSWGQNSGDDGIYYIPEEAVTSRLVSDAWTVKKTTY